MEDQSTVAPSVASPNDTTPSSFALEIQSKPETPQVNSQGSDNTKLSSNFQTSFTLFNSFFGTVILVLPFAYKTVGLGLALIMVVIVSYMTTRCLLLLLKSAEDKIGTARMSLSKLTSEILGNKAKIAVQVSMIIMQLGANIALIIFAKNFLDRTVCAFNIESLCGNTLFSILFCVILTVPLSMLNSMHYFYLPSVAASIFIIVGLVAQMYYNVELLKENPDIKDTFKDDVSDFNITDLPLFFGIATYSFEGIGTVLSVKDSMAKPQDFSKLLKRMMVILVLIYLAIPTICYLALGDKLEEIVFFSLPTSNLFYMIIQILYVISALLTFPIPLFPVIRIFENSKKLKTRMFTETGETKSKLLRYGMRLAILALVFVIAYTVQSFMLFLNLIGSCVVTFIGFVLPIWMYHVQFKGRLRLTTKALNYLILAITIILGAIGVVMSIIQMINQ